MTEYNDEWMNKREVTKGTKVLQFRKNAGNGVLHIQGWGDSLNRDYGWADKFTVPNKVIEHLNKMEATHLSFATEERVYIRPKVRLYERDGDTRMQVITNDGNAFTLRLDMEREECVRLVAFCGDSMSLGASFTNTIKGDSE